MYKYALHPYTLGLNTVGLTGTSKVIDGGRITIDGAIRNALNISVGDTVEYTIEQVLKCDSPKRK
jgi:hypothetical protein